MVDEDTSTQLHDNSSQVRIAGFSCLRASFACCWNLRWAQDAQVAFIKDYAANYNNMSDQLAQDYMSRAADIDLKLMELRTKYVPIFEKVISSQRTTLWYKIDRRLDLLINLQLAAAIPVVDASK
jgi:hypothetical protein